MPIANQTLETLEFFKIREQLARHTAFSASRELVLSLEPDTDQAKVARRLRLTGEARRMLDEHPDATVGGARDIRTAVQHAARGGILEASSLLEIAGTLRSMRHLRTLLLKLDVTDFPLLLELTPDLPQMPALEEEIERTISDEGEILDSASSALARIRKEIRVAEGRLQERMHNIVSSGNYASALQEAIVTVRDGRYVVPVKAAQRRALPGLVHDQSASGATLYIEPMAAVELNNQLREAQLAEEQEIKRILAQLSERVGSAAEHLVAGVETLARLDLSMAQAKYAFALRCVEPQLVANTSSYQKEDQWQPEQAEDAGSAAVSAPLLLKQARHPLLNQSSVVPIDVWLGGAARLILITGPNTGGKTVALKTVGLLALMAQAGLHIPASEPARLPVFSQIFADIGDEQSIEQSLSTFSSHMTNIIQILEALQATAADRPYNGSLATSSLVLLDELGAGTDPVEGSALARAICQQLLALGCLGLCTTHYADLKAFAHNTPGVENASVEFDVETLAPTYRLTIGLPGRSNALAIAARLGLDEALVEQARGMLRREETQIEDLLATIRSERETAAAELQRAREVRADAEKYRERYEEQLLELQEALHARIDAAGRELEQEVRETRAELRRMREDAPNAAISRKWAQEAEQRIKDMQQQVEATGRKTLAAAPGAARREQAAGDMPPRPLKVGDTVFVRSVKLSGEILQIDEEDELADVQVGGFRMQVGLNELQREKSSSKGQQAEAPRPQPASRSVSLPPVPEVPMMFDIRGWRAADVAERLERYLNDAYLAGLPQVRIIHGKGSGVLRQVVRDMLQGHALVKSFSGGGEDGGEGVTIAHLVGR